MVHLLEDCNLCAIHAKRVTISAALTSLSVSQLDRLHGRKSGRWEAAGSGSLIVHSRSQTCFACCTAVPKDLQLARRIRGPIFGVSSN